MTFEQFQATARDVADLGAELKDDALVGVAGRLYAGDLYIAASPRGGWSTLIGNREYRSADLAEVERPLYGFAVSEGITPGMGA